jgi:hypothetical protein
LRAALIVDPDLAPPDVDCAVFQRFLAAIARARFGLTVVAFSPRVRGVNEWNRGDGLAVADGNAWWLTRSEDEELALRAILGLPDGWREELEAAAERSAKELERQWSDTRGL